ncbi:TRAP transporter small permease [Paracoccus alkanivorans]|uniref:TRAP transporter small permease protein n=1 Tax=Paracoccus alkanivorans TaxID=2116655 RepID=A0A3M0M3L4_9RHOB|nr:TRAP transporter small permease [Paracoccus alkanivorans]RMC32015.1 TRAP transporter small permease [Paracoccus alkanivorans]
MSGPSVINPGDGAQNPVAAGIARIGALIEFTGKLIAVASLSAMFVALLVNVALRYAFGSGIAWAYEIHAILLPWLVAAGLIVAASRGTNIAITILPDLLPPPARRLLRIAVEAILIVIAVSILLSSAPILKASQFQTLSALGIKQIWGYSSLIYAFSGMAVISALDILRLVMTDRVEAFDPGHGSLS